MSESPRTTYARALADTLQHKDNQRSLPAHVLARPVSLLYPQPIVFAEARIKDDPDAPRLVSSTLLVITDATIAITTFAKVLDVHTFQIGVREDHTGAEVTVELYPRTSIAGVRLPAATNDPLVWQEVAADDFTFPSRGTVELTLQGRDESLVLPFTRRDTTGLDQLVANLATDLATDLAR